MQRPAPRGQSQKPRSFPDPAVSIPVLVVVSPPSFLPTLSFAQSKNNLLAAKARSTKRDTEEEIAKREVEEAQEGLTKARQDQAASADSLKEKRGVQTLMNKAATKAKADVVKVKAAAGTVTAVGEAKVWMRRPW